MVKKDTQTIVYMVFDLEEDQELVWGGGHWEGGSL